MISIIIPTYNRGNYLYKSIRKITTYMDKFNRNYEVIIVLDGGNKETKDAILYLCNDIKTVRGIILKDRVGQQNATLAGIRHAKYEKIVTMDDDLEHDLDSLPIMLKMLDDKYDLVYGVGKRKRRSIYRRIATTFKEFAFIFIINRPKDLTLTSYKVLTRQVADYISLDTSYYTYISARVLEGKFIIGQVFGNTYKSIDNKSGYRLGTLMLSFSRIILYYKKIPFYKYLRKSGSQYIVKELIE